MYSVPSGLYYITYFVMLTLRKVGPRAQDKMSFLGTQAADYQIDHFPGTVKALTLTRCSRSQNLDDS